MSDLLTQLRRACAEVASLARHVRINEEAVPGYAAGLPLQAESRAEDPTPGRTREERAAFWLILDAVNYGSGWFPTLNKRPGRSGYHTIATGIRERFAFAGPWGWQELEKLGTAEIADVVGQDPSHELMSLFARSLNDLGRRVGAAGSFTAVVDAAGGSASRLVGELATWDCFADTSTYEHVEIPFLKRAQITAADLHRAGVASFIDLARLTMFADNLVPHVLRLDGILSLEPGLAARIGRGELIEHGSPEEIEIRACAVHAVELIVAQRPGTTAAQTDQLLWLRGQQRSYKASARHRARTTAY